MLSNLYTELEGMPLYQMLETTAFSLSAVFEPSKQARLLYNISCGNSPTDLILYVNKNLTTATNYEQHDIYGKSFDVFCGSLTRPNHFQELKKRVRKDGIAEDRMILYDKKNKPFLAEVQLRPVITTDDFDDLVLSYYMIEITRLPNELDLPLELPLPQITAITVQSSSDTASVDSGSMESHRVHHQKDRSESGGSGRDSGKTSAQSLSTLNSDSDEEREEMHSQRGRSSDASASDDQSNTDHSSQQSRKRKHYPSPNDHQTLDFTSQHVEEERLTKTALQRLDDRSWDEVSNTKRRKFIDSK